MESGIPMPSGPSEGRMYRVKEVASLLGVCLATAYNLIASGDLSAYSIGPGRGTKRVSHDELMAYKERCRLRAVRHSEPAEAA